ncbi:MAG TPA: DeoR family transcriptional regulator [Cerasibacillus sp.]|uniref:DeoR family transcriptional regulator n=1 Tax=Cerasibacillus sp. TaxID=2498711 RepID=UPI002F3E8DD1
MLPIERRNRIKALIKEKEHMKIAELSELLDVSEMTIHRDLKPLIDEGVVMKTFGGVTLAKDPPQAQIPDNACVICRRPISERLAYRIILKNNEIEMACCSHCGLMRHQQLDDQVMQALTHDFLKQTTINAVSAWYVMDTSLVVACCQPQVLSFESKEYADKFVKGFGGQVYPFNEAIIALDEKMRGGGCCHH